MAKEFTVADTVADELYWASKHGVGRQEARDRLRVLLYAATIIDNQEQLDKLAIKLFLRPNRPREIMMRVAMCGGERVIKEYTIKELLSMGL